MCTHIFGLDFEEKSFCFNFLIQLCIYLFIFRYLFLYDKGILAFFNILWYKKFYVTNNYKTQEWIQGISGITHV